MRRGAFGTLLVATLAVAFFVSPGSAPPASAPEQPSALSASKKSALAFLQPQENKPPSEKACKPGQQGGPCDTCAEFCPAQGLLNAISRYFGPHTSAEPGIARHWGVPQEARPHMRFVVATVADPIHTHLSLFFDRQIDAIQEAVQADQYLFARSYVPWDSKDHPEDSDFRVRLRQEKYQEELENYPGLMIFRQAGVDPDEEKGPASDKNQRRERAALRQRSKAEGRDTAADEDPSLLKNRRTLFVFLVAETPTAGINKSQFHQALAAIQEICAGTPACKPSASGGTLSILGPTFSGSLYSLAFLLRDEVQGSFSNVVIHSGSASSQTTIGYFASFVQDQANVGALHQHIQFRAFQESYEYALDHMLRFACDQGYKARDVAVVSEDETAYGSVELKSVHHKTLQSLPDAPPSHDALGKSVCVNTHDVLHLYFPRDIAQLRSAYQHDLQAQNAAESAKPRPRSSLQLDLTDTGTEDDSVPHFSRSTTPLSQEAIMLGLVANLQKHHIAYVVLTATNPLDMLFLVRYFRTAYSEGRVVTIDTDLLLPRELDDSRLNGVMAITSYPLIPGVGDNVALPKTLDISSHLDRVFPSNYAAGTFNALLSLLAFQDESSDLPPTCGSVAISSSQGRCADLPVAPYAEYGWPNLAANPALPDCRTSGDLTVSNCPLAPPLWLTVLGHSGFWPVTLLDTAGPRNEPQSLDSDLHAIRDAAVPQLFRRFAPQPWIALAWFFIVIACLYIYLVWCGSIISTSRMIVKFAPKPDSWRNSVLFTSHLLILALLLSLLWPWLRWGSAFDAARFRDFLFAVLLFVICALVADLKIRGGLAWAGAFLAAALGLSGFAVWAFHGRIDSLASFTLHRYIHVTSGVSPLLPGVLLIFGALWWCWYNLEGLAIWEQPGFQFLPAVSDVVHEKKITSHDSGDRVRFEALTIELNSRLLALMHSAGQFWRVFAPAVLTSILAVSLIGFRHPIRSLEGSPYDQLYSAALLVALFFFLCELFGIFLLWPELRRLLVGLDRLPLRRAFQRMDVYAWTSLWQLGGSAIQDFFPIVARQFEALTRLKNLHPNDPALLRAIDAADAERHEVSAWFHSLTQSEQELPPRGAPATPRPPWLIRLRRYTHGADADFTLDAVGRIAALQTTLASACAAALIYLNSAWAKETDPVWRDQDQFGEKEDNQARSRLAPATRFAEDFVCLFYFNFISSVFLRMRTLVWSVAGIFVFVLLSVTSYPFEPKANFHTVVICLFLLVAAILVPCFAQMHRDATLSRITKTTPGELGIDFWIHLITFAGAPLLSLLAAEFPMLSGSLFSWLQPALQALK